MRRLLSGRPFTPVRWVEDPLPLSAGWKTLYPCPLGGRHLLFEFVSLFEFETFLFLVGDNWRQAEA